MASLKNLLQCLSEEHTSIRSIVGHSDVAPNRKIDPGAAFNWTYLAYAGLGCVSNYTVQNDKVMYEFNTSSSDVKQLKADLSKFGYGYLDSTDIFDDNLAQVIRAFHLHFNKENLAGGFGDWTLTDQGRLAELLQNCPGSLMKPLEHSAEEL